MPAHLHTMSRLKPPTKEQSQLLPPFQALPDAAIVVPVTEAEFAQARTELLAQSALGFDTESKPLFHVAQVDTGPHVVQLATPQRAWILQLHHPQALALAREVLGNQSYKSDDKAKQTPERLLARRELLSALERGQTRLGLRLVASNALLGRLADDASGDALDAILCLMQAAWAQQQHESGHPQYGLPPCDPLEGWIVTA